MHILHHDGCMNVGKEGRLKLHFLHLQEPLHLRMYSCNGPGPVTWVLCNWGIILQPQPPLTRRKCEQKSGRKTVEFALFWSILDHILSGFLSIFCLVCGGRGSFARFWVMTAKWLPPNILYAMADPTHYTEEVGFPRATSWCAVDYMRIMQWAGNEFAQNGSM